jgi:hypothetical protein
MTARLVLAKIRVDLDIQTTTIVLNDYILTIVPLTTAHVQDGGWASCVMYVSSM